jgi:predicted RNase H-like nuclease (RuvC/YqgF family)
MAENGTTDIKIQLESLRKDIEAGNSIQGRLDTAIDKLTDVSTSIKSMLAVHEEKIQRQEQIDEIIFEKLKARQNEIDDLEVKLKDNIELSEKRLLCERVSTLEKYKWLILGGSIVVGWVLSKNFAYIMNMMNSAS